MKPLQDCPRTKDVIDILNATIESQDIKIPRLSGDSAPHQVIPAINKISNILKIEIANRDKRLEEGCGYVAIREATNNIGEKAGVFKKEEII